MFVPCVPARGSETDIFSFRNIYRAYLSCRKNKRNTINALKFEINAEENILSLEKELKSRSYHPSRSILFATQKPKLREIFAADFRDRVVHHLLIEQLEKLWEPIFIHDSYACRIGKGTHKAVLRLQTFLRRITKNGRTRAYFLQLDIKDFFTSIDKDLLFSMIKRRINNPDILWLARVVIFWDCTDSYVLRGRRSNIQHVPANKSLFGKENKRGVPIGNLTSQFFANIYLNELDQFVKHTLKCRHYVRYVDDFVLLSRDREELVRWRNAIDQFVRERLKITLHPVRRKLLPVSNGIDFLGYIVRPGYILVRRRVVNNLKVKIKAFKQSKSKDWNKFRDTIASYLGHFKWANSFKLQDKLSKEVFSA
jgi:RNA-directed DNA polymerase